MRVLIIGGGIGGLCLANGLTRAGIQVEVFERSAKYSPSMPGYGIHLNGHGLQALYANLPAKGWAMLDSVAQYADDVVRFQDENLHVLGTKRPGPTNDAVTRRRGVGRIALREALLDTLTSTDGPDASGIDGVLRWEHEFVSYDHTADGSVRVKFANGNEAVGDLLIGADGANSAVRRQYLPAVQREDLGIVNIAGRLELTGDNVGLFPRNWLDGSVNNIVPAGPGWMFVATWGTPPEPGQQAAAPGDAASLVWAWVGLRESYPMDPLELDADQLRKIVLTRTAGWAPVIEAMVQDTPADTITPVALKTMPQLPAWTSTNVTVMGDAIHNMTPMAGIGANTALRDAEVLRQALVDAHHTQDSVVEAVRTYEVRMREYANEALALSTRNARNAASEARFPRQAFRTLLRVAEAVPPLKRRIFPTSAPVSSHVA
jgi:2-polyprenyl-6-methoxyphenol hydroxylase-like FAD-dependent oxidoreductase